METKLPGTLWVNRGRWNWRVKLPGDSKRRNIPLRLPGARQALPEDRGRSLALSLAWRIWERSTRDNATRDAGITLDDAITQFFAWAETYYRHADGTPTREAENCKLALRHLRSRFGQEDVDNIGYVALLEVRNEMESSGLQRATINQRVGIWRRFIAWALENRICLPATKGEWCALGNLKRNRTAAPEGAPVMPVSHLHVKRTLPFLSKSVQSMVRVHEFTGMRSGELTAMRPCDIERRRDVWIYRPAQHKNQHRGQPRIVVLGPRAQSVLSPSITNWHGTRRIFGDLQSSNEYGQAVRRGVHAAQSANVVIETWTPNQLRHACGTRVRRRFGVDAARAVLGHSRGNVRITDRYTRDAIEAELIAAATAPMRSLG